MKIPRKYETAFAITMTVVCVSALVLLRHNFYAVFYLVGLLTKDVASLLVG